MAEVLHLWAAVARYGPANVLAAKLYRITVVPSRMDSHAWSQFLAGAPKSPRSKHSRSVWLLHGKTKKPRLAHVCVASASSLVTFVRSPLHSSSSL